jgi:hypothetical protein
MRIAGAVFVTMAFAACSGSADRSGRAASEPAGQPAMKNLWQRHLEAQPA